jgi:hypothetical protein
MHLERPNNTGLGRCLLGIVLVCFVRLTGRFGQVFQRCVEVLFGFVRPGLAGGFPKLLNLGFFRHA